MRTGVFEYVEPSYTSQPLYKPNDPEIDSLYFMEMLNMYQAWDSTMGDTNVVIGISDTGFDIDHPDLVNSVKYNYNDPIDGVDNDGDGYIDNFRGWDLGDNDNNPQVGSNWQVSMFQVLLEQRLIMEFSWRDQVSIVKLCH